MSSYAFRRCLCAFLFGSLLCLQGQAALVTATATDVADTVAGQDRWRITYRLTGELAAFDFVSVFFPTTVFVGLTEESAPSPLLLTAALLDGDAAAGSAGLLTLSPEADMGAGDFFDYSLSFVRVGAFSLQSYEIAGVDANGEQTVDPRLLSIAVSNDVPEPASWMLVGLGMALLRRKTGRPAAR